MDRSFASRGSGARRVASIASIVVVGMLGFLAFLPSPTLARADGPGVGSPWAVSVGDSYISGEAGRWAGNTLTLGSHAIDALGAKAYYDNSSESGELIPFCHRSRSAEIHIGGVSGENLACSGSKTYTSTEEGHFKPGLDFYNTAGHEGQALMLLNFARTHNVKLVAVSIGGNNYNFAGIVETCIIDYISSSESRPVYCKYIPSVLANFTPENIAKQTAAIQGAIVNVAKAMREAGYSSSQYTLVVQDYPSPIPDGAGFRYPQANKIERLFKGGCGIWNEDANWANSFALTAIDNSIFAAAEKTGLSNIERLQLYNAFDGRRLCESRTDFGLLEEVGLSSWQSPGALDKTEWINQARILNFSPYEAQEDLHPNYWGQHALQSCLTLVYDAGSPRSGACTIAGEGFNSEGNPKMALSPTHRLTIARPRKKPRHKPHHKHRRPRHPRRMRR